MRARSCLGLLSLSLLVAAESRGVVGANDVAPAATLLFPWFEVDVASPAWTTRTTLIQFHNVSGTAVLTRVTLWTDLGIPTFGFNVYLTGHDFVAVNLSDVFVRGFLPYSGPTVTVGGPFSTNLPFPSCAGILPASTGFTTPAIPASVLAHIQASHTGVRSPLTNKCSARVNAMARGYVTVDTVSACSVSWDVLPDAAGYFGAGGIVTDQNVLVGEVYWVDPNPSTGNYAQGQPAVHIEADASLAGALTFYGRLAAGGTDHREALPTSWATSWNVGGLLGAQTNLLVWRDPGVPVSPFDCSGLPAPYPLPENRTLTFNPQSQGQDVTGGHYPVAAAKVPVVGDLAGVTGDVWGWLLLDLKTGTGGVPYTNVKQSWVTSVRFLEGRFSEAFTGVPLPPAAVPPGRRKP